MGDLGARCWRECQDLMTMGDRGLLMGLEGGWMGRSGGQKPGFFPEHFVTAHKNRKNPVSLVLMRPGLKMS
ncbi:hypothetical protein QT995_06075 [Microcoleus sp. S36b_A3]|uniref:hypothetical protein n=1 Tax=unclassified Microcoleus TaxID=2642155 RepID=UPI002FD378D3